jgi:hypothetical protein
VLWVSLIVLALTGVWACNFALAGAFSWLVLRGSDAPVAAAIFVGFASSALLAGVVSGPIEAPDASAPSQQDTSPPGVEQDQPKPVFAPLPARAMIGRWFKTVGRSVTANRISAAAGVGALVVAIVTALAR